MFVSQAYGSVLEGERALLDVIASVTSQPTVHDLFRDLTDKLSRFVHFDRLGLLLHDEACNEIVLAELFSTLPHGAHSGIRFRFDETPVGEVIRDQKLFHIPDVPSESRYPVVLELLRQERLRTFCYVPLSTPSHRLGALGIGTRAEVRYSDAQLALLERALKPVAIAVDNIVNRERLERSHDRLKLLLEVNNALVTEHDPQALFEGISRLLQRFVSHEFIAVAIWVPEESKLRLRYAATREPAPLRHPDHPLGLEDTPSGRAFVTGSLQCYDHEQLARMAGIIRDMAAELRIRSMCSMPLKTARGKIGTISIGSRQDGAFPPEKTGILQALAGQVSIAVENALSFARVEELNRRLSETKLYLEEELQAVAPSDEILGSSAAVRKVLQQIKTVAPTDATVLIYGETGSGKELVARALHQQSPRGRGTFVKLNCAAIPSGLLESELFGHEKGAFTGAIAQKIGRFEIAHQGTLFLDEIGEIPLELQPKLLRVLQEKEFERLGGTRTIRSDARLVSATNRDLKTMVETNRFRGDLFYRLNVFPIAVPPLRERKEDIPYLAMHFTQEYSRRLGRKIRSIAAETIEQLVRYPWPGNIRELQNLIERSVILTAGDTLRIPAQELQAEGLAAAAPAAAPPATMQDVERETIVRALREAKGVVGGPNGAAARLGMKRTTLLYRMEKLGLAKPGA